MHEQTSQNDAMREAIQAGLRSLDAGHSIPYEEVRAWLLSWGTEQELPSPSTIAKDAC